MLRITPPILREIYTSNKATMDHNEDFPSPLGSTDERDCYLGVPLESETTNPNHQFTITPRKTNMEPKNGGLEDDLPFQSGDFQVPC